MQKFLHHTRLRLARCGQLDAERRCALERGTLDSVV